MELYTIQMSNVTGEKDMELYTIQMSNYRLLIPLGVEIINITHESGEKLFAPTKQLLWKFKGQKITEGQFIQDFKTKLISSLYNNLDKWVELLNKEKIALACYCRTGVFCHRHVVVDFIKVLAKELSKVVSYKGEVTKEGVMDRGEVYANSPRYSDKEMETIRQRVAEFNFSYKPEEDGITHINVYSRSKSRLGKMLSNFYPSPFKLKDEGEFKSVEGYWYYLLTDRKFDELRDMDGYGAKAFIADKRNTFISIDREDFMGRINRASIAKIWQNLELRNLLRRNELPLIHYYVYGDRVVRPIRHDWVVDAIDFFSWELKQHEEKLIIAGSRTIEDYELLKRMIIEFNLDPTEIVSGAAKGVDRLGERLGTEHHIPVKRFEAKWDLDGKVDKAAGIKRNIEMGDYADKALLLWDGQSKGTKHMLEYMKKLNKKTHVVLAV